MKTQCGATLGKTDAAPTATRRESLAGLVGIAAGAALAASGEAVLAQGHHDHGPMHQGGAAHQRLIDAGLACVNRGSVCLEHCIRSLSVGNTSMKECLRTVAAMLPMCDLLARYAALDARRLRQVAKLCADVCRDCEEECRKHEDHHAACKACAESCAACIKECKAVMES